MLTRAPVLQTNRLRLQAHTAQDIDHVAALWANPDVVKYIGGTPSSYEASWSRLLRYAGHWQLLGFGYWAIFESGSGAFIGEIGLADYRREITPSLAGMPEMGWVLSPEFHGKGYAYEAANAVLNWADEQNIATTCCIISPEHTASLKLAAKCGFRVTAESVYHQEATLQLQRTASNPPFLPSKRF
jgi:RimJ/RimL family protein N-acetyltransferase